MDTDRITVFTQSSIRIRGEKLTVYADPYRMEEAPHDADVVLITHDHSDHFSPEDIKKVCGEKTVLAVPAPMKAAAGKLAFVKGGVETVAPGEQRTVCGLPLETVAAYNRHKPFHPKNAGWVGYVLEIDGQRIYIAGDTDMTEENRAVRCDIALVPVGGTFTMNAKEAASLVNEIRPAAAIPTHYGSIVGKKADADTFASLVDPAVSVQIKMLY